MRYIITNKILIILVENEWHTIRAWCFKGSQLFGGIMNLPRLERRWQSGIHLISNNTVDGVNWFISLRDGYRGEEAPVIAY